MPVFTVLENRKKFQQQLASVGIPYDVNACLQMQVLQMSLVIEADCYPSIGESIIDEYLRPTVPIYSSRGGDGPQLAQHPKFSEVPPLSLDRAKSFSHLHDGLLASNDPGIHC